MIETFVHDLRHAARGLGRTPSFTAAAILTLAIGIAATTAVFSVVYGVLFRPLPFPNADRLVQIVQLLPSRTGEEPARAGLTPEQIAEWRATSTSFAEIGYYSPVSLSLTGVAIPIRLNGSRIAVPLFRAVGVRPLLGRLFEDGDELAGNEQVVVLAHDTWARRFAAAPELVGRSIALGGRGYRVIGVMPQGFGFPAYASPGMSLNAEGVLSESPEFWVPMVRAARPSGPATGGMTLVTTFALLRPGVSLSQALAEANTLMPARADGRFPLELANIRVEQTRGVRRVLLMFQAGVIAVLFIACANITNLLLARAASRRRELEVRLALGAPLGRLVRFALAESLIISACGGAAGWLMAYQAVALVRKLPPYALPRLSAVQMDIAAAAAASATAIAAGLATGLWALARSLRAARIGSAGLRGASMASGYRPSRFMVVAQTAAGVVLLAGAALLLGSFVKLTRVDRGFDPEKVLTFRVAAPPSMPATAQHAFYDQLLGSFRALPGVSSAAAIERSLTASAIAFGQVTAGAGRVQLPVAFQAVSPGVFESLRIPLRGRDFTSADRGPTAHVVIVNETFARRAFPEQNALGQTIGFSSWPALDIVGVAADIRPGEVGREVGPAVFLPAETSRGFVTPTFILRADGSERLVPSIRAVAARADPAAVVFDATPLADLLARQVTTPKFYGVTATIFASMGLLLAALGLFGMLSYSVNARTRELGIRIAIGASRRQVMHLVLRETLLTVGAGIGLGLAGALYVGRLLSALLFGLQPSDPALLSAVAVLFLIVALLAAYLPARRATLVDPVTALRAE